MVYTNRVLYWEIVDGDTVKLVLDLGYHLMYRMDARLSGIDAPETRLLNQRQAGTKVKEVALRWLLETEGVNYPSYAEYHYPVPFDYPPKDKVFTTKSALIFCSESKSKDKYGRGLGNLSHPTHPDATLSEYMLSQGIVREYQGGTKSDWEEEELEEICSRCEWILRDN